MKSQIRALPAAPGIYIIRHRDSGKLYVGSSVNIRRRAYSHENALTHGTHANAHLQAAFALYGDAAFEVTLIGAVADRETLRAAEAAAIARFRSDDRALGYNVEPVVMGPVGRAPETILKMAAASRGKKQSAETIARRVASLVGGKHPPRSAAMLERAADAQRGKTHTPEHKAKIAAAMRGRRMSDETRQKMSRINSNRSDETLRKMALAATGKKASKEARARMSVAALGKKKPPRSPGHCLAIAAAKKAWWAARRGNTA
jgi:group I intron endonuclease